MQSKYFITPILILFCNSEISPLFANENNSTHLNKNLDYLFESNFPLDDYIYKGGKRKPNNQNIILDNNKKETKEELKLHQEIEEELKQTQVEEKPKPTPIQEENKIITKTPKTPPTKEQKYKMLLRDSILGDRGNTQTYFSNPSYQYGVDSFSNQENIDNATNEHRLFRMVRAGRLIPAVLMNAISSDLAGIVSAQIEEDIYATMGKAVMIPRGSKAIGYYQNDNTLGQNRLQIQWREIITPQGVNILLTNNFTSDSMGMSGAVGSVNNKYLERYGIPYAISTLTNVLLLSYATKNGSNVYSQEIYNQSQNDLSNVLQEVIEQQRQIKPTIEIKAGSRIFIVPTHHIWFPKPKNGEIMTQYFN